MTTLQKFLGLILVIFCGGLAWLFIKSLLAISPGITATIIGGTFTIISIVYKHYETRNREINARHFLEKKTSYMIFINLMFEVLSALKKKNEIEGGNLEENMLNFKKELIVWGNQEVFQAYLNYEKESSKKEKNNKILLEVDKLLRAIRKDLGHNDSQLKPGELVSIILTAEDREQFLESN